MVTNEVGILHLSMRCVGSLQKRSMCMDLVLVPKKKTRKKQLIDFLNLILIYFGLLSDNLQTACLPSTIKDDFLLSRLDIGFCQTQISYRYIYSSAAYPCVLVSTHIGDLLASCNPNIMQEFESRLKPLLEDLNLDSIVVRMGNQTWLMPLNNMHLN